MGNSKARLRRGLLLVTMLLVSVVLAFAAASCGSKEESGDIGNENASVLIVGGAPDASLGADGDICFDGTSQKLYVKSVGRWVETSYRSCAIEDNVLSVTYADGSVKRYALAADEPSEDCTHENLSEVFAVYPAKCVVPGIGVQSCLKCGESFSVIIPADGLSHELVGDHCTICGETVTFKTEANDDGGVTITGMNAVPEDGNVEIPDEIAGKEVTVKAEAFKGEKEIKSVTVGSASIGDSAFEGCESLSSVTFKESTTETTIGDNAFKDCENLDDVSISENVVSVGADAFAGTGYYENTDNWKTISGIPSLLNNGKFLLKVDRSHAAATVALLDEPIGGGDYSVPEGTLVIADEAFAGVTGLSRVTLPAGVKTVGRDAFKGTDLQSIILPAGIANYEGLKGLDLTIYFLGGEADWKYEDLSEGVYYRSDDLPEKSGKFWRYEDNVVTAWPNLERLELTEYTKEFLLNDTFSTGDLTVTAVYDDHTTETLGADDYTVDSSAVDMTKDGIYTVTVTHRYIEATYEITVKLHTYTVTVVYGNGDANETKSVTEGKDNYTLPAEPHKTGYAFLGWKVGDGEELKQADETVTITGDTTVTAQWQVKTPDVKLNLAGGTGVTYSVSELENDHYTVTLTGEPTYEKRRFTGWTVTVGGVDSEIVENEVNVPLADDMTVVITANWVELVTVTYRYNSTQAETSETVDINTSVTLPTPDHKTGYTFEAWYEGDTKLEGETYTVEKDVTLDAHWTAKTPSVSMNYSGGSAGSATYAVSALSEDETYTITVSGTPVYENYEFRGWTVTVNGVEQDSLPAEGGDVTVPLDDEMTVTVTAVWADLYTVTVTGDHAKATFGKAGPYPAGTEVSFTLEIDAGYKLGEVTGATLNGEGKYTLTVGEANVTVTVTTTPVEVKTQIIGIDNADEVKLNVEQVGAKATVTVEGTPYKMGHTFTHWTVKVGETDTAYADSLVLALENADVTVTYTANWTRNEPVVEIQLGGGEKGDVATAAIFEEDHYTITITGTPEFTKHSFVKWTATLNKEPVGVNENTITVPLADEMNVVITAVWADLYSVTATGDHISTDLEAADYHATGDTVEFTVTVENGYKLVSVMNGDETLNANEEGEYSVTVADQDIVITVTAVAVEVKVTVKDADVEPQIDQNGASATITVGTPQKTGYTFGGWTVTVDGQPEEYTDPLVLKLENSDVEVIFTASWQVIGLEIEEVYGDNADSSQVNIQSTLEGDHYTVTVSGEPTRAGYRFNGWTISGGAPATLGTDGGTITVPLAAEMKVTITAVWVEQVTVTFEFANGIQENHSETVDINSPVTLPEVTRKTGYDFEAWYEGDNKATVEGNSYTVTKTVTLTAHWTARKPKVTFDWGESFGAEQNGASQATSELEGDHYTVTVTGQPTRAGYRFDGWTISGGTPDTLTTDGGKITVALTDEMTVTITAKWVQQFTVTFHYDNDDQQETSQTVDINTSVTLPAEGHKTGYTFEAWYEGETKLEGETYTVVKDVTLTAHWTALKPTVTFNYGGGSGDEGYDCSELEGDHYTITITSTHVYDGHEFTGWSVTVGDAQAIPVKEGGSFTVPLSDNMTVVITANWVEQFTVTYELGEHAAEDATAPASETVDVNSSVNLPAAPAAAEGYEFAGWQVGSDAANLKQPNDSITVTADVTVTAQWKAYYTLTIEGTTENITVEITEGRSDNGRYYENSVIKFKVNVEKGKYDISEVNASDGCLLEGPTDGVYTLTFGTSDVTLTVTTKELHEVKLTGTNLDQVTLRYEKEGENHPYYYEGDTVNLTIEVNSGYTLVKAVVVGAVSGSSNISGNSVEITFGVDDVTIQVDVRKTHDVTFVVTGADTSVVNLEFSNSTPIAEMQATVAEGVEYSLIVSLTEGNNEKYTIKSVTSSDVELSEQDGQYTFTVGTEDITITITVEAIEETQYNVTLKYEGLDLDDNGENVVSVEITTDNDDKLTLNANATVTLSINKDYENKYAFASVEANPQGGIFTEEQTVYTFTVEGDITLTITLDRLYEVKVVTVGDAKISYTLNVGDDSVKNSGVVGYYKVDTSIELSAIRVGAEGEHYTYTVEITGISDTFDPNPESYSFSVGTSDITITITAVKLYQVKVVTDGDAEATYTLTPNGVDANEEGYYPSGTTLTLNEIKVEGDYTVTVSSEDVDLSSGSVQDGYTFTVGETDITITITAKQNEYKITVKYVGLDEGDNGEDIVDLTLYPEDGFTTDTDVLFEVNINALYENKYSINTVSATGCKNFDYEGGSFTVGTEDITITITLDRLYHVEVVTDTDAGIIYDLNPVDVDVTKSEEGYYKSGTNLKVENIMSEYTVTVTLEDVVLSGSVDEGYPFTVGTKDITIEIRFVRHTLTIEGDKDNVDIDYTRDVNNGEAEGPYLEGETVLIAITAKDGFTVKSVVIADVEEGDNGYSDLGDYNYIITMKADVTITITTEAVQVTPKYTVQFVAEGATSKPENVEVEGDGTVDLTGKTAEKENYKFLYWYYLDADGEEYKVEETIKPSELVTSDNDGNDTTLTLHAKWVQLFTVTLTVNEESLKGNVELSQNDSVLDLSEGSVQVEKGEITLTVTPVDGYEYTVTVKGESLSPNDDAGDEYTITVEEDTDITVAFTKTAVPEVTEVTLDFTKNFDTYASVWDNSYAQHTIQFTAVGEQNIKGEVAFSGAAKQTDINNMPVVRPDSSTEYVEISLTDRKISSFEFTLKEWSSSKTFTDIHLEYWDGTSWKTCSDVFEGRIGTSTEITTRTIQSEEGLTGVSKVRISITGSGKQQLGIQLAKIVFEKPLSSEDQAKVNQALAEIEDLGSLEASVNSIPTLQTDSATEGITYAWSVSSETELCKVENNEITIDEFPTTDQKVSLKVKILLNGSVVGSATVELTIKGHEHSYVYEDRDENTHSVSCSVCGKELDPEAHEYDNGTDATCNKCNHERDISNLQGSYTITTTNNTIKNFAATYNSYNWEASDANGTISGKLYGYKNGENIQYNNGKSASFMISSEATVVPISKITITTTTSVKWQVFVSNSPCATDVKTGSGSPTGTSFDLTSGSSGTSVDVSSAAGTYFAIVYKGSGAIYVKSIVIEYKTVTDEEKVQSVAKGYELPAENKTYTEVKEYNLPTETEGGVTITWALTGTSDYCSIVDDTKLNVTSLPEKDAEVSLTATFHLNGKTATNTYTVTIKAKSGGGDVTGQTVYKKVTSDGDLQEGKKIVFAYVKSNDPTKNVVSGGLNGSYLDKVTGVEFAETYTIITDIKSAVTWTLQKSGDYWEFINQDGKKLGETSTKNLSITSGKTEWSISVTSSSTHVQNVSSKNYLCYNYNASSPRFTTYTSIQAEMLIFIETTV